MCYHVFFVICNTFDIIYYYTALSYHICILDILGVHYILTQFYTFCMNIGHNIIDIVHPAFICQFFFIANSLELSYFAAISDVQIVCPLLLHLVIMETLSIYLLEFCRTNMYLYLYYFQYHPLSHTQMIGSIICFRYAFYQLNVCPIFIANSLYIYGQHFEDMQ